MPPSIPARLFSVPLFLAPAFTEVQCAAVTATTCRTLSTTSCLASRRAGGREKNKQRGVSALRSTGTRVPLVVEKIYKELPKPLSKEERDKLWREQFPINKDHGLYAFFNEKRDIIIPGDQEGAHGRPWAYEELAVKDFADLHRLFWACIKERNRVLTRQTEFMRLKVGYGGFELKRKFRTISRTMFNIKHVLRDRYHVIEEAKLLLERNRLSELFPDGVQAAEEFVEDEDIMQATQPAASDDTATTTSSPPSSTISETKPSQPQI